MVPRRWYHTGHCRYCYHMKSHWRAIGYGHDVRHIAGVNDALSRRWVIVKQPRLIIDGHARDECDETAYGVGVMVYRCRQARVGREVTTIGWLLMIDIRRECHERRLLRPRQAGYGSVAWSLIPFCECEAATALVNGLLIRRPCCANAVGHYAGVLHHIGTFTLPRRWRRDAYDTRMNMSEWRE